MNIFGVLLWLVYNPHPHRISKMRGFTLLFCFGPIRLKLAQRIIILARRCLHQYFRSKFLRNFFGKRGKKSALYDFLVYGMKESLMGRLFWGLLALFRYPHKEALFGIPKYGGSVSERLLYG